jgi:hypothetical protein
MRSLVNPGDERTVSAAEILFDLCLCKSRYVSAIPPFQPEEERNSGGSKSFGKDFQHGSGRQHGST